MLHHTEIKSRQVSGKMARGEGTVPEKEGTLSEQVTMYGSMQRGTKFDENCHDIQHETPMEEEHTSRTR